MSNWFEDNPTKSILTYTLVIAGATWGVSTFILQDNRISLARAELEEQKTIAEQYKAKVDILQADIAVLRSENGEYRQWLSQIPNAVPIMVPQITELRKKVASLTASAQQARTNQPGESVGGKSRIGEASKGRAFIDDATGLIVTVKDVTVDRVATVVIQLPGQDKPVQAVIDAGKQWSFKSRDQNYRLIVTEISYWSDTIQFRISLES